MKTITSQYLTEMWVNNIAIVIDQTAHYVLHEAIYDEEGQVGKDDIKAILHAHITVALETDLEKYTPEICLAQFGNMFSVIQDDKTELTIDKNNANEMIPKIIINELKNVKNVKNPIWSIANEFANKIVDNAVNDDYIKKVNQAIAKNGKNTLWGV